MDSDKRMDGHSFSDRNSSKNRQQIRGGRETRPKGTEVTHVTISSPSHLFGMSSTSAHMVRMYGNYYESLHRNPGTGNKKVGQPEEVDNLISMEFLRQVSTHMCGLPKNTNVVQQPNIQCRRHFSLFKIPSSSPTNHHLANMLDIRQLLLYSLLKLLNSRCLCFKMRYWRNWPNYVYLS